MYYMKPLKSPTHIHFWWKFLWIRDSFSHYDFVIFPVFYMRIMQSEKFCRKYTRALSPVWNCPPYTRIIRERNFAQIYMRIAVRLESVGDWLGVDIFAFVCIMFCVCGHRLDKVVFVDWLMSNFGCKSVTGLYKFIVKMWLCICNCMCICVCIWYWLWFCYRLDSVVIRL